MNESDELRMKEFPVYLAMLPSEMRLKCTFGKTQSYILNGECKQLLFIIELNPDPQ